ncbi:MAG: hypothetical protein ACE5OS_10380 [Anaerolineae bacterium]
MGERLRILELIEAGEISAEEGARRLEMLAETAEGPDTADTPATLAIRPALVRVLWQAVFWSGVGLTVAGGLLVTAVYAWGVAIGWLTCGWPLLTLGVLGVILGWWLQRANWFSLRVRQTGGPNVSLAFPLPLGLVAWGLRIARPFVPQLEETVVDELLLAMQEELRDSRSFVVEVDEREDSEQVQVYFG